jgi:triacylglycerol lipase
VIPADSAVLAGAVDIQLQQVCGDSTVTHAQLPTDPLVIGLVGAELGSAPAATFSPADCGRLRAAG